ncbi:MAG: bifunctional phosphoribosylaminoimidazolecarboxamide formyltransferase/IMP cyclohydrolase [Nocardioidaceae bacterium]|nr:bifunctional phosphoribosylaminoimidazolecarboxamide formyltransferase/IMP cyclohydrolase [Nocardioidaceae bacterium]
MSDDRRPITRALISVYDKERLEELGRALAEAGVTLVSTGSTASRLAAAGLEVTSVEDLTGFPECLDGRVKTLHPRVHAGILADQRLQSHRDQLASLDVEPFDLVVSNLYPFTETVRSGASPDECVEQIDIGGPSMVRGAAKNHASVAIVTSPTQYGDVLVALSEGGFTLAQRQRLAAEAFAHTATYDVAVAEWFSREQVFDSAGDWPDFAGTVLRRRSVLRYGENSHQPAALYVDPTAEPGLAQAEQLHGKEMSFNNYIDAQAAHRAAHDFPDPAVAAVAIIKHANPCGIALGRDIADAHAKAHACDPVSAYGGVVAANQPVSAAMASQLSDVFTEVIVAPGFDDEAVALLTAKKNVRLLRCAPPAGSATEWRPISGGMLVQIADRFQAAGDEVSTWQLVSGPALDDEGLADIAFAWRACRSVKSNAILLAADRATVGVGMGQVNRVDAARLAVVRAGDRARGSVAASDAFFPFADGLQLLIDAGVRAVVQPGGSVRDEEVRAVADAARMSMYFTGTRHFSH